MNFVNKKENFLKREEKIKNLKEQFVKHNEKVKQITLYNELNKFWEVKNTYNSIIPLIFYTCWHTKDLPPLMKENYNLFVRK